jgi:Arabinose efflux permease
MVSDTSRRNVLIASALGSSLAPFMVAGLLVALPTIGQEFGADASSLGWLTNVFFLAAAVFLVPMGRVADVRGAKKVFTFGIGIYLVSVLFCVAAPSIHFLIGARFLTGIGASMVFGTSIALLSLVFPIEERGKAIGINVTAMSVGFLLGFFLGGLLTFYIGWRSIFALTLPVEILVLWLILSRIRGECELARERELDLPGMVLYGCAIFLTVTGFTSVTQAAGPWILAGGVVLLTVYLFWETRALHPLLPLHLFLDNRTYAVSNFTVLLFNISNFASIFILTLYLQSLRLMDVRVAGIILLIPVIFMAVFSTTGGRLSDHIPPRMVVGSGIAASALGMFLFTFLDEQTSLYWILGALSLSGLGIAFCQAPLVRTSVSAVPREMTGLASGMIETMRLIGMTISIAISIIVFTLFVGNEPVTPELHELYLSSMRTIFWIYLMVSFVAMGIALIFLDRAPERNER